MLTNANLTHTPWRTAITDFGNGRIGIRGVPIEQLMGWGSFGAVVFLLLCGRAPSEAEGKLFNAMLIASCDHGPTSPSTLTARVIASGNRRAPEAAVGGGLLAIGDAHGGAGEAAMVMLYEALREQGAGGDVDAIATSLVDRMRGAGQRLPGLGHRFHDADPRVAALWRQADDLGVAQDAIAMMRVIERALEAACGKRHPVNIDGAIAAVLAGLRCEPIIGRLLFLIGRCAGIAAHVREELTRESPMRIRFPYVYDGPPATTEDRS